jgi:hypothetical protein
VYHIDKEKGLTLVLWEGVVTADEFLAHVRRLCADADWPPPQRLHLSHLRFTSLDASMDDATIEQAAHLYGNHLPTSGTMKVAIVASEAFTKERSAFPSSCCAACTPPCLLVLPGVPCPAPRN